MSTEKRERYNVIAITLHWVMAVAFIGMFLSGLIMVNLDLGKNLQFQLYQWHKSLGVLLLLMITLRIVLRLFSRPPALPLNIPMWEGKASKLGHWLLYLCMFVIPLAGWLTVSSSAFGLPTIVFNWFEWPHIPGLEANESIEKAAKSTHRWFAYAFITLIIVHIGAVIKHAVFDNENLLRRMWLTGRK